MLRERTFSRFLCFVLFWVVLTSSSWAGQVVTEKERLWARKAVEEEKAIAAPEGKNTLAVLYFQNKTGQRELDPLQKGIALMLITDLSKVKGLQVVERVRLQALTEEMGLGVSGLVKPDTAPRIGKLLGAQWLAGGNILEGQLSQIQIQSNLLDVPGSKILGQPLAKGEPSDLFLIEKDLLFDIIKLLNIEVKPEEEKELRKACSTNIYALISLFKGIDESDHGEYEKAAELYKKALKLDPNICIAKEALNELHMLGLIPGKKRSSEMLRSLRDRTSLTDQLTPEYPLKRAITPKDVSPVIINPPIRCGDGVCDGTETCSSCPQDCGICPPTCGNGVCDEGEDYSSCPEDCPG
jgi:TolB-like protein